MSTTRNIALAAIASSLSLATAANAQTVSLVDHQGTWSLYADTASPKQVCFVAAAPQAVEPIGANRGPTYFYISAWPKDGIRLEPSIKAGYPVKPDKEMTVTVGTGCANPRSEAETRKPTNAKDQTHRDIELLRELETSENDFTEESRLLKLGVMHKRGTFNKGIPLLTSFDECFVRSEWEIQQLRAEREKAKSAEEAKKGLEQTVKPDDKSVAALPWDERLAYQLLRREAEALLKSPKP